MSNRVFIPQEPMRRDRDTGQLVSIMNFNKARQYGEPVVCCPSGPVALNTAPVTWRLRDCLRDFSDNDYLIAVGDPTLFCMAAIIAAENNRGRVRFLKWDQELRDYILVEFDRHPKKGGIEDER